MPKPPRATGDELARLERERGVVPTAQFKARRYQVDCELGEYPPEAIKALREKLSCSQRIFAAFIGTGLNTLRRWEQGKARTPGPVRRLFDEINRDIDHWRQRLQEAVTSKSAAG